MATVIANSLTDHSPLDGTNDAINGAEVDANPMAIAQILDGTTATDLGGAGTIDILSLRVLDLGNAAGAVQTNLVLEWDPADGGQMTDNSSGVGIDFKMPDDGDTQDVFGSINVMCLDDAAGGEDGEMSFKVMKNGTNTEILTLSATSGVTFGVDDTGYDFLLYGASAGAFSLWDSSADTHIIRGATAAGPGKLNLSTGELTVVDGDILGRIDFQAPLETSGTDAIAVGASIWAEADDTFASGLNDTDLVFAVAESETAAERMRLSYDGTTVGLTFSGVTTISTAAGALNLTPAAGSAIVLDGTINVDAGVVTGATSITSTAFVGDITGDVTGNADTFTATANNSANETVYPVFVDGATGAQGAETDTGLTYNPSTGLLSSAGVTASGTVTYGSLSDGSITITAFVDEDDMSSNSATLVPTQQSVKAYVDSQSGSNATTVTITDNESTNENNALIFTAGGDVDGGNLGLESDGTLTYNPSTGKITATGFIGALTGNVTGDVTGNVSGTAGVATTVTITDNENTNETNAIIFTAGGDVDGGDLGLESDGDLTYNPSSGLLSATAVTATGAVNTGALTSTGNISFDGGSFVFNESGADKDFRIEGDANANLFVADASTDRIGIGTAAPDGTLHVHTATAGSITAEGSADDLVVENNNHGGISILTPNNKSAYLYFGDVDDADIAGIEYSHVSDTMRFYTATVERMRVGSAGAVYIAETANTDMTIGLTINQAANDDEIIALKSSDVGHPCTAVAEADTYGAFKKSNAGGGGLHIMGFSDDGLSVNNRTLLLTGVGGYGTGDTSDTVFSAGVVTFDVRKTDGSTGVTTIADTENGFVFANADHCRMSLKGNGVLHLTNTTLVALDDEDDNQLVRAMQRASSSGGVRDSKHDNPFYSYDKLLELGLAGEADEHGTFLFPVQKRLHAHEGAMWQTHCRVMDMGEKIETLQLQLNEANDKLARLEMN